jgi:hypothetical protein
MSTAPCRTESSFPDPVPRPFLVAAFAFYQGLDCAIWTNLRRLWTSRHEAPTDLLGGQVQVLFVDAPTSLPYVRSGKLRALAVTTATRLEILPDTPALAEYVPDFEASYWLGLGAPKDTPAEIVDRLNQEISAIRALLSR